MSFKKQENSEDAHVLFCFCISFLQGCVFLKTFHFSQSELFDFKHFSSSVQSRRLQTKEVSRVKNMNSTSASVI